MTSKVSSKKQYEIEIMANLVHEVCQDLNCSIVLDIGSGLVCILGLVHFIF